MLSRAANAMELYEKQNSFTFPELQTWVFHSHSALESIQKFPCRVLSAFTPPLVFPICTHQPFIHSSGCSQQKSELPWEFPASILCIHSPNFSGFLPSFLSISIPLTISVKSTKITSLGLQVTLNKIQEPCGIFWNFVYNILYVLYVYTIIWILLFLCKSCWFYFISTYSLQVTRTTWSSQLH